MTTTSHPKTDPRETQQPPEMGCSTTADASSPPRYSDVPEVAIAVMGPTGTGKSTFVNLVSGSQLGVSAGLDSCTTMVQCGNTFDLDGRRVTLIDTPGFDDTNLSDVDLLTMIALFLSTSYKLGEKLAGVLYFHRISDARVSGTPRRNLRMFRELCGNNALKNVVIVTNMWGAVDPQLGEAHEAELRAKDTLFKPILDKGGQMARHDNTASSARDVLRRIVRNHPLPLHIQEELVDEGKGLHETNAGKELNQELNEQIRKHKEEMRKLEEEMRQAIENKDEEMRRELQAEAKEIRDQAKRLEDDIRNLTSDFQYHLEGFQEEARREITRITAEHQENFDELSGAIQANSAQHRRMIDGLDEAIRVNSAWHQATIDGLDETIRVNATASEEDRALMNNRIEQLSRELAAAQTKMRIAVVVGQAVVGGLLKGPALTSLSIPSLGVDVVVKVGRKIMTEAQKLI